MKKRLAAMFLIAVAAVGLLLLTACSSGSNTTAATMHLRRTEGTVSVSDGNGKNVPVLDNLGLYSGYGVGTRTASCAWIDLDDVKLTKLDQNSEITIQKEDKWLEIEVKSGSLFFNVTEPLEDGETMDIRTSTMLVGIRGTCGWVEGNAGLSRVYLLEGKVECSAGGQTVQVSAGEVGSLTQDGKLVVEPFDEQDIPAFVREEMGSGPDEPADNDPDFSDFNPTDPVSTLEGEIIASGKTGALTWELRGNTLIISGTGDMENYTYDSVPWQDYSDQFQTVMIGDGVTSIGDFAFWLCGLEYITIPGSVTRIGDNAFNHCTWLTGVTIPSGVTSIGAQAFYDCTSLATVTIPDSVTSIGAEAFYNCRSIYYITIPDSVTSIGRCAFWQCYRLQEVTIPSGLTSIEYEVFYYCSSLTSVTIPDSVTSIDQYAFYNCNWLADVYYGGSESQWNQIGINERGNDPLFNAEIHYNS